MIRRVQFFRRFVWGSALATAAFLFWLGLSAPAAAATLTFPSVSTPSLDSGASWSVGQAAGGSIIKGQLDFDVTGLSQANLEKHQIFAMFDAAQPTAFANHGYWIHFRKRAQLPFDGPGFQFKLQIDCAWEDENVKIDPAGWIPERSYHFTFSWDEDVTKVEVTDSVTGQTDVSELPLPSTFKAQDQTIVFGVAGLANSAAFPAEPGAQYSNITLEALEVSSEFDDFDGYPECEFDGGCGCVTEGDPTSAPCSESSSQRPRKPSGDPFRTSINGLRWNWKMGDTAKYLSWKADNENENPTVAVQAMTPGLPRGEEASFTAVPENYRTRNDNIYYSWCVRDSVTGKTANYNSVLAGGLLAEASSLKLPEGHGSCCEWITRQPAEDLDDVNGDGQPEGDGMDDNWERQQFVGRSVNGRTYATIEEVLPNDDPDRDGAVMDRFVNQDEGTPVTVVAGLVDSRGNKYYPGGSDGLLTNVEEYILGTDPLNGDTDGDGYVDEDDYLGEGQSILKFVPEQAIGTGYYDLDVSAVGLSSRKKVYVAQATRRVHPSQREKLEISLFSDKKVLPVGAADQSKVNLKVNVLGGDANTEEMDFRWIFQGESICAPDKYPELSKLCDFNQSQVTLGGNGPLSFKELPGMDQVDEGGDYTIGVRVVDSASRQDASAEIRLKKGTALTLTTSCGGLADESVSVSDNPGTATEICVSEYGVADLDPATAVFYWAKDAADDQAQSGLGRDSYRLTSTKPTGSSHQIDLRILYGPDLAKELQGAITVPVVGAMVRIDQPAGRIETFDSGEPGSTRTVRVAPGETIVFRAITSDFGPVTKYQWSWQAGSDSRAVVNMSGQSDYSFLVPADAVSGTVIPLSVIVRAQDEQGRVTDAEDSLSLLVSDGAQLGGGGGWAKTWAALASVISPQNRFYFQLVALLLGAAAVLAGIVYLLKRLTSK